MECGRTQKVPENLPLRVDVPRCGYRAPLVGGEEGSAARDDLVAQLQQQVDARDWAGVDTVIGPIAQDAAAGSKESLELLLYLIDRCRLTHGAIWSVLSDPVVVEDAAQETVVAVTRGIQTFRGDARFTTWLYRVAHNSAMATVKQRLGDESTAEVPENLSGMTRSLSSLVTDRVALDQAIDSLPAVFREALLLREVDQLEYEEIGERLELPLGTVRSRIARARARLAVTLRESSALPI
jgi:RNA polymerase sigma-70 factor (ECF subfamily)